MKKSRLLMKEQPLVVDKELASLIGLNEAIVLQQIEYWTNIKEIADIKKNKTRNENFVDGYYWTYNTIDEWTKEFPFWSYDTVKRTLKKLRDKNLVVTGIFNLKGYDRTLWYRVNHEQLITLENAISAKCPNEENSHINEEKNAEPLKTDISAKCPNGLVQNAPMHKCKMPQPIPKITTKTSTKISTCSSSAVNLIEEFEANICELKKTTKIKFECIVEKYDSDFILSILEQCSINNIKSYAGFEKVFNSYLNRNCIARYDVEQATEQFRINNIKKTPKEHKKSKRGIKINNSNFEPRAIYNDKEAMKNLEYGLLGWNKDEE